MAGSIKKYDLFISWTGSYARRIAEAIKRALDQIIDSDGNNQIDTFLSSVDIGCGDEWEKSISLALKKATYALTIVTQDILHSDWVAHETGALSVKAKKVWILLLDSPASLLPTPLRRYQHKELSIQSLSEILGILCASKNIRMPSPSLQESLRKEIKTIRDLFKDRYVTHDENRWNDKIERSLLLSKQGGSPYDLYELVNVATEKLVLIAQNHYFLIDETYRKESEKFWPRIMKALINGVQITIVAMHPDVRPQKLANYETAPVDAISLWSHYMNASAFKNHVDYTWEMLLKWKSQFNNLKKTNECNGELKIYGAYFTPLTISVVDPSNENGFMVISPRPANEANYNRPQFIIYRKSANTTFEYYWSTILNSIAQHAWIEM